jgi:hypothetical protein
MSKFGDSLKSKGKIPLSGPLDELKKHIKTKDGRVEFSAPPDLEEDLANALNHSVKALNELVAKGVLKVDANGNVEVLHGHH